MILSDYFLNNNIITDGYFSTLGLSNSKVGKEFLTFLDDEKYINEIDTNMEISGLITTDGIYRNHRFATHIKGFVIVDNPRRVFFELHNKLANDKCYFLSNAEDTMIGKDCVISPTAVIDKTGVYIGNNVIIEDFVTIKSPCIIGDNSHIHAGAHLGGSGFEFKRLEDDVLDVKHCGSVEIGKNVVIWENTTIHKAVYPWDKTVIGDFCRIGANTHIDHGAKADRMVEICAGCTVSGRVEIGEKAFIGPGSIISNRVKIGNGAKVLIGSVVSKSVQSEESVSGNFAIRHEKHLDKVKKDANM